MPTKEPVLLTVLIETGLRRWFAGGIDSHGSAVPLLRSNAGDFDDFLDMELDEQVSYLRHRFANILQQGCDRLWHHQKKAGGIVFVADGQFDTANPELCQRVAEHFVTWMTKPPVTFLSCSDGFIIQSLQTVAGNLTQPQQEAFKLGLFQLASQRTSDELWELARRYRN